MPKKERESDGCDSLVCDETLAQDLLSVYKVIARSFVHFLPVKRESRGPIYNFHHDLR